MPILQRGAARRLRSPDLPSTRTAVRANLMHLRRQAEPPVHYLYEPPAGTPRDNCTYEPREVVIRDCRPATAQLSIDHHGFELHDAPTRVVDFADADQVTQIYYREIAELARSVTGARHAYVFDHLVRKRDPSRPLASFGERGGGRAPGAAGQVHNDFTDASGRRRLALVLGDTKLPGPRFSIVTLWRPILPEPVLDTPLAVCDASSVADDDLIACELRYRDRIGEIYLGAYNPAQRWSYVPAMVRDEVLVFKQYDSAPDVARFTPHAAFDHPDAAASWAPRQSIEVRCLVTYD